MKLTNYINEYQNHSGVTAALDADALRKPYVAYLNDTGKIDWNTKEPDYASMPLTYEFLSDGEFEFYSPYGENISIRFRRINGEYASDEWKTLSSRSNPKTRVQVKTGDLVQFGGNTDYYTEGGRFVFLRVSGATFNVYGNIMSLLDKENFSSMTSFPEVDASVILMCRFPSMFEENTGLLNAEHLILPVLDLSNSNGNGGVYAGLFNNCTNLMTAPKLPATTLAYECYNIMFSGCTSLANMPELPATNLAQNCYRKMFVYCTNLNYVKCLATTGTDGSNTENWLLNVSPTGTFVKHPDAVWPTGPSGIPDGWTVIDADV